jgi:hypothetical protein
MKIVTVESHAKSIYIYTYRAAKRYGLLTSHAWSLSTSGWKTVLDWEPLRIFCLFLSKFIKEYTVSHLYFCILIFYLLFQYLIFFGRIISSSL